MPEPRTRTKPRVVVGIDGSDQSTAALEWAASYAELTGATVRAITAWMIPASYGFYLGAEGWDVEDSCRKVAEEQVATTRDRHPAVGIELIVVPGHPAQVLVDAAEGADLLVVGSRGHGGFTGMLLGSTSTHCVHAAPCPVLVCR